MEFLELLNTFKTNSDSLERRLAVQKLVDNNIFNEEIIQALVNGLEDTEVGIRDICSYALSNVKDDYSSLAATLIAPKIITDDIELRNLAGDILINIGHSCVPALLPLLDNKLYIVRQFTIDILGQIGDNNLTPKLIQMLDDVDVNVVVSCIEALGNIKAKDSIEILTSLYDENEDFRPMIIEAIGKIGGNLAEKFLIDKMKNEEDLFLQTSCIDALAFIGEKEDLVEELIELLPNSNQEVQLIMLKAIIAISFRKERQISIPNNLRYIAQKALMDDDPDVRGAGLLALGNSYIDSDINGLINELTQNIPDTQGLILSNILSHSDTPFLDKFFREYATVCEYDQEHIEFFELLPSIWEYAKPKNQEFLINLVLDLIIVEHSGFSQDIITILISVDREKVIKNLQILRENGDINVKDGVQEIIELNSLSELSDL